MIRAIKSFITGIPSQVVGKELPPITLRKVDPPRRGSFNQISRNIRKQYDLLSPLPKKV